MVFFLDYLFIYLLQIVKNEITSAFCVIFAFYSVVFFRFECLLMNDSKVTESSTLTINLNCNTLLLLDGEKTELNIKQNQI